MQWGGNRDKKENKTGYNIVKHIHFCETQKSLLENRIRNNYYEKEREKQERKKVKTKKDQITPREYLYTPWRTYIHKPEIPIYTIGNQ
jgi:hypothetical protein